MKYEKLLERDLTFVFMRLGYRCILIIEAVGLLAIACMIALSVAFISFGYKGHLFFAESTVKIGPYTIHKEDKEKKEIFDFMTQLSAYFQTYATVGVYYWSTLAVITIINQLFGWIGSVKLNKIYLLLSIISSSILLVMNILSVVMLNIFVIFSISLTIMEIIASTIMYRALNVTLIAYIPVTHSKA
jgi:hypothetical protein